MKVKFQVIGVTVASFTSPKSGRTFNRSRCIGMAFDAYDGSSQPAVADLAYDCPAQDVKAGDYLLDCSKMEVQNSMLSFTFVKAEPFKASKG